MNKQEAIKELKLFANGDKYDTEYTDLEIFNLAITALEQPTATEFLNKARIVCDNRSQWCNSDSATEKCPAFSLCWGRLDCLEDESDLVRKVMEYPIS